MEQNQRGSTNVHCTLHLSNNAQPLVGQSFCHIITIPGKNYYQVLMCGDRSCTIAVSKPNIMVSIRP